MRQRFNVYVDFCCVLFTQLRYTVARFNYTTECMERFLENAMYASRWLLAPCTLAFRWR